jgi:arylsulfatase A-like enzyme
VQGTASNNYPLRGGKNTLWEGGTRVAGAVAGPGIPPSSVPNAAKFHATDWLPTLVSRASGKDWHSFIKTGEPPYLPGDGVDNWSALSNGVSTARDWLLLETHQNASSLVHGHGLIIGDWKIIKIGPASPNVEDGWWPAPGTDPNMTTYLLKCGARQPPNPAPSAQCVQDFCLFNITADPCEYFNVAADHPQVVSTMLAQLAVYSAMAVPQETPNGCTMSKVPVGQGSFSFVPCDWVPQL